MTLNHEPKRSACSTSVLSLTLALCGCSGHMDLQQLAKTPDELHALHQFKAEHPNVNSQEDLSMALDAYRAPKLRKQALAIQFRHRYPNATPEEVIILVDDQMAREGPYPTAAAMDCANTGVVPLTSTSCH